VTTCHPALIQLPDELRSPRLLLRPYRSADADQVFAAVDESRAPSALDGVGRRPSDCRQQPGLVRPLRYDARNEPSRRLAERVGFVLEGQLRNAFLDPEGQPTDELVFALTPDDAWLPPA
jgi:hypothetical protein